MRSNKRATRDRWSSALAGAIKTYKRKGRRVRSSGAVARVVTPSQLLRRGWVQKHNPKTNVYATKRPYHTRGLGSQCGALSQVGVCVRRY